jgi:N-acetylated-alpha-linked acidic dipeptidase
LRALLAISWSFMKMHVIGVLLAGCCVGGAALAPQTTTGTTTAQSTAVSQSTAAAQAPPVQSAADAAAVPAQMFGFKDFAAEQARWDKDFLAVPDAQAAGADLKVLTSEPHVASSPEDKRTADFVAQKFRDAGLETEIVPYKVVLTFPKSVHFEATDSKGVVSSGPTREHVNGDPYQDDLRVIMPYNASSASGDVSGAVVYANYGTPEDFKQLDAMHIDVRGKIVLVRYGENFRGVKTYIAQQRGAAGVLIYSDPADDGYARGKIYPEGPMRPETGVQRGAIGMIFKYPGDPTTPGVASTPDLPEKERVPLAKAESEPQIISIPISYHDAAPILEKLGGPEAPKSWQGALHFAYHVGPGPVQVHMNVQLSYDLHTIWDVIGRVRGTEYPDTWVVAGNHRDAWVYGAVDPNSGTAAMLEAVHGVGALLKAGWKPKRTVVFASWDAEEQGLIGSTEWVEQHSAEMAHAAAYFNMDVGVAGPNFGSEAVPSLKEFVRAITREVPSPKGGSVYAQWLSKQRTKDDKDIQSGHEDKSKVETLAEPHMGDLGSGSDFTPFLQHAGVPSTDIGSNGPYGVYHSVFDNYAWFTKFADPNFVYLQQMARVFGLEMLHMADADVLPYDYRVYAQSIGRYLGSVEATARKENVSGLNFKAARKANERFNVAAEAAYARQQAASGNMTALNSDLRGAEEGFLAPEGLANRTWFKHTIYAPGEYTGYAAVDIPAVTEPIVAHNPALAQQGLDQLTAALNRAADVLQNAAK